MSDLRFESVDRDDFSLRVAAWLVRFVFAIGFLVLISSAATIRLTPSVGVLALAVVLFGGFWLWVLHDMEHYDEWAAKQRPYLDARRAAQKTSSRRNGSSMRRRVKAYMAERRKENAQ